jgi:hypothetical protein
MEEVQPESSDDRSQAEGRAVRLEQNRTNMTIFHFVSTVPKWSLSLFLFLAARSIPVLSPSEAIQKPLVRLQSAVALESESYRKCTIRASNRMQNQLKDKALIEYDRVIGVHQFNRETIKKEKAATESCVNATKKARASLAKWQEDGMTIPWVNFSSACTEKNRSDVIRFVGEEFRVVENEVSSVFEDYFQSSKESVEVVASYALARAYYDYDYFVGQRIQPVLSILENVTLPQTFHAFVIEAELRVQIQADLAPVGVALDAAKAQIDILMDRITEFAESIEAFHDAYSEVYQRLEQAAAFFQDLVPLETPVPAIFDLRAIPWGDALLPSNFQVPNFRGSLSFPEQILENVTDATIEVINKLLEDIEKQATKYLREFSVSLSKDLSGVLAFGEYNPPQFVGSRKGSESPRDEIQILSERGEAARAKAKSALDKLKGIKDDADDELDTGSLVDTETFTFSDDQTVFGYLRPIAPTISIPDVLMAFLEWLYSNIWMLEVLVHALRLWQIEAKYARGAVPDLPEIDYGVGDELPEDNKSSKSLLLLLTIFRALATPWMVLLLIFFPVTIGAVTFWYPHVQKGCQYSRNGTFFANHILAPLLINEASALGNGFYAKGEFECKHAQRRICNQKRDEIDAIHQSLVKEFGAIQRQLNYSSQTLHLVDACVDSSIDNLISQACCGLKGFTDLECLDVSTQHVCPIDFSTHPLSAFRPLTEYTMERGCMGTAAQGKLMDGRFDCERLTEPCKHIPCMGVNEQLLRSQTIKSDCEVETYVIRCFLFVIVVLYHAVVINIFCSFVFKGTRQVMWRRLYPEGIKLRTYMTDNGDLVKGDDKLDRSRRVAVVIQRFETHGKLQLGLGIVVGLVWFISIFLIRV